MYMSNHPDTLVAYAKWFAKVPENISSAEMSAIDSKVCTNNRFTIIDIPVLAMCTDQDYRV